MTAPRLDIDLNKIQHNTRTLVQRLNRRGIAVSGVTKAFLGHPQIARAMLKGGVSALADSRIDNIEAMRRADVRAAMHLIRSPMLSQVDRVVASADVSFNTELDIIGALSTAASRVNRKHGVVLMTELGDLREGIMPCNLERAAARTLCFPNIVLKGIGTNLGCRFGASPNARNMAELSALANQIEANLGINLDLVTGGNSSNLRWARKATHIGRINDLRLGEAILLGKDPLHDEPIEGLHTDAIVLVAEVIESNSKPSMPRGDLLENPFGNAPLSFDRGNINQAILSVGHQDIDPAGLHTDHAIEILSASSDHLIVDAGKTELNVGSEVVFGLNYSALLRAMTSPFVTKVIGSTGINLAAANERNSSGELIAT
jgi:predicted amino acid racemase